MKRRKIIYESELKQLIREEIRKQLSEVNLDNNQKLELIKKEKGYIEFRGQKMEIISVRNKLIFFDNGSTLQDIYPEALTLSDKKYKGKNVWKLSLDKAFQKHYLYNIR